MRIAVCDDEALFREALHAKILQDGFAHDYETDVEEYGSGRALLDAQEKGYSADVYFLDVQMDQGTDDGIRTARELRRRVLALAPPVSPVCGGGRGPGLRPRLVPGLEPGL